MKIYSYAIKYGMLCLLFGQLECAQKDDVMWSWNYRKQISLKAPLKKEDKPEIVFSQNNVPLFSQLIFSWNAFRPPVGHFSFYVSVKNASNDTWGSWHQMIKWGANMQRSFRAQHDEGTRYEYVRFEVDKGMANGFRIKVVANEVADMNLLKELHVNVSDFSKFAKENSNGLEGLTAIALENVPCFSQRELDHPRNASLCSPTACSMVIGYLTKKEIDPLVFAQGSFDHGLDIYGSWPFNVAHAFEQTNGKISFATSRLNSFKDIHRLLASGMPVLVSVRGDLHGAPKTYDKGHILVVVGWDANEKSVICHDPAFESSKQAIVKYPINSFIDAWERSRRLAYVARPLSF